MRRRIYLKLQNGINHERSRQDKQRMEDEKRDRFNGILFEFEVLLFVLLLLLVLLQLVILILLV